MDFTALVDDNGDIDAEVAECFACQGDHTTPLLHLEHPVRVGGTQYVFRYRCPGGSNVLVWIPPDKRSGAVCHVCDPIDGALIPHMERTKI